MCAQRFFLPKAGFFHDEIESPGRVTILVIKLSGVLAHKQDYR